MSKVYLEDSVLTDIADAIREKTGGSGTITPANMPTEIESISGGGEPLDIVYPIGTIASYLIQHLALIFSPEDINTITIQPDYNGNKDSLQFLGGISKIEGVNNSYLNYLFSKKLIIDFSNTLYPGISSTRYAFNFNEEWEGIEDAVLDVKDVIYKNNQYPSYGSNGKFSYMFAESLIRHIGPKLKKLITDIYDNTWATTLSSTYMFYNCRRLKEDNFRSYIISQYMAKQLFGMGGSSYSNGNMMYANTLFHELEIEPFYLYTGNTPYSITIYGGTSTSSSLFRYCCLRKIIFKPFDTTNPQYKYNGIDLVLTGEVGWSSPSIEYHPNIVDEASYYLYKDDDDAITTSQAYSLYNLDSVIETINSLPDMTLNKFTPGLPSSSIFYRLRLNSNSGSGITGKRIGDISETDVAVATAKGWTVTLS